MQMPEQTTQEETDEEAEQETFSWAQQSPTTRLKGTPVAIVFSGDPTAAQPRDGFGIVFHDPAVVTGSLWRNTEKPEDATMDEAVDEDSPRPTDYRIADESDREATFSRDGNLKSGENGPNEYAETEPDAFGEEQVLVWYNGMAGNRIGRTLDFNGLPFVEYKTGDGEPYLMKGLYQNPQGWRAASSSEKRQMVEDDLAPRVARVPILRYAVEEEDGVTVAEEGEQVDAPEILIDISRWEGGRGYEAHVFDAETFAEEFGSLDAPLDEVPRGDYGLDTEAEIDYQYTDPEVADAVLEAADISMHVQHGSDWATKPSGFDDGSGFDTSTDTEETGDTAEEVFIQSLVDELAGSGVEPDDAWDGGISGIIERNESAFAGEPPTDGEIREALYERLSYLDPADLETS